MDYYGVLVKRLANFERVNVFIKCHRDLNAPKCLATKRVTCLWLITPVFKYKHLNTSKMFFRHHVRFMS